MVHESASCYRHDDRPASVACQRCEKPICRDCMHQASVGFHCTSCVRSSGQKTIRQPGLRSTSPVTFALMAACVVAFIAQGGGYRPIAGGPPNIVSREGLLIGSLVQEGEYWRIVTAGFLHLNLLHIGFNMYALYIFGPLVERAVGRLSMALCYAGGLLGGSFAVLAFNFDSGGLGASGAVLGLAGAVAAILRSRGVDIRQTNLGGIFLINLALPLFTNISFWGHFGGIAAGALTAFALVEYPRRQQASAAAGQQAAAAVVVVLAVLAVAAAKVGGFVETPF